MQSTLIAVITVSSFAQAPDTLWTRTYGGMETDQAFAIQPTDDAGYIIAGYISSTSQLHDIFLVKTNANGDTLWTHTYGGDNYEYAHDVRQTEDGGYIIAGHTHSYGVGSYDMYLIKTDAVGDTLWTHTYGGQREEMSCSVHQTQDKGYIVAGHSYSFCPSECDFYIVRADSAGDTLWTRTYGGDYLDQARSLQPTTDGGFIIAGYAESPGLFNIYMIKINNAGDTLWTRTYGDYYGEPLPCSVYSVQQTSDDGFILAGYMIGPCMTSDIYLVKTDSVGDTLWTNLIVQSNMCYETAYSVQEMESGDFIVAGVSSPFYQDDDVYLLKFSSTGTLLWTTTYGGGFDDVARAVRSTEDGGFIIAGYTYSFGAGEGDFYLIKTLPEGTPAVPSDQGEVVPMTYALHSPYPNPFNPSTTITFQVPQPGRIELVVYNIEGQLVRTLKDETMNLGTYTEYFDGKDNNGNSLSSGIYFCRMSAPNFHQVQKMVLIK